MSIESLLNLFKSGSFYGIRETSGNLFVMKALENVSSLFVKKVSTEALETFDKHLEDLYLLIV